MRAALPADAAPYLTTASTKDLVVRGTDDPLRIAEALWPAASIIAACRSVEEVLEQGVDAPKIVRLLILAEALERALREDPSSRLS